MTTFQKAEALAGQRSDRDKLLVVVAEVTTHFRMPNSFERSKMRAVCRYLADALDRCRGSTLQQRWNDFEKRFWPKWKSGVDRHGREYWTWGARVLIPARMIVPSLNMLSDLRVNQWIAHLPEDHRLAQQHRSLLQATDSITWTSAHSRQLAVSNGLRILLVRGYDSLHHIKDDDLKLLSVRWSKRTDALDAALCSLGVFSRTPCARAAKEKCGPRFSTHAGQPRAACWPREVAANLPDRLPPERSRLSGSKEHCREQKNWAMMWPESGPFKGVNWQMSSEQQRRPRRELASRLAPCRTLAINEIAYIAIPAER